VRTDKILATLEMGSEKEGDEGEIEKVDVLATIRELLELYGMKGEATGEGSVFINRHKLVTVFDNIIKNMHEKSTNEPELECHASVREEGETVTTVIYDTGSPIKDMDRMFEPFFTTKKSGLGIGLFRRSTS
jgi:C4-dicarboxylate-specific signal transduction histidine kinase